jgi:hypothetical protein
MVANLGLYAIALVVFGVSEAVTKENTESQVCASIDLFMVMPFDI